MSSLTLFSAEAVPPKAVRVNRRIVYEFITPLYGEMEVSMANENIINELYEVVVGRKKTPVEGSYTNYLYEKGREKICKKMGEEAVEVVLSAVSSKKDETIEELADLMYHALVLMADMDITPKDVEEALRKRR